MGNLDLLAPGLGLAQQVDSFSICLSPNTLKVEGGENNIAT